MDVCGVAWPIDVDGDGDGGDGDDGDGDDGDGFE